MTAAAFCLLWSASHGGHIIEAMAQLGTGMVRVNVDVECVALSGMSFKRCVGVNIPSPPAAAL